MASADRSHSGNIPAEQAYCPACDLKHVRQADWLCPRCGMPVETEAWRAAVRSRGAEPERALGFPLGSLVAGALLALTGGVLAVGFARNPGVEHRWPLLASALILVVLGLELLLKVTGARWVAIAVAAIALLVGAEDLLRVRAPELMRDPLPLALRSPLHGVLGALGPVRILSAAGLIVGGLLLLTGRPRPWRIVAGALVGASLAVAEIVGWYLP
ncbi:MAG TPA: hypothetical protein VLT47_08700 [Anaeromyxobacteraceae bacterium]|nr:hypothetical protein [Anaeromyxobacteraceae bacterium]